jgi:3',5'-cyclic-nucleotide phosphodiesterase
MDMMENHYFNGETWANFGDEAKAISSKIPFQTLKPTKTPINNTTMTVKAFPLSHVNPFESTAFLIKNNDAYVLYLGDTGADNIEKNNKLHLLWGDSAVNKKKTIKRYFYRVSFPNEQADNSLYGHLTPKLLLQEMHASET